MKLSLANNPNHAYNNVAEPELSFFQMLEPEPPKITRLRITEFVLQTELTGTLSLNVVSVTQAAKLLLTGRVPHVESDGASVSVEYQRMHLHNTHNPIAIFSVSDPDPLGSAFNWSPGSGSAFGMRIRIQEVLKRAKIKKKKRS
jgi:hypothetical protein